MKSILPVAAALLLAAAPALAQEAMTGIGTTTCGDYNDVRQRVPDGLPDGVYSEESLYVAWAQGFVSALNAQAALQKKPLRVLPRIDAITRAIRTACTAKPQLLFFDVLTEIYNAQPAAGRSNNPSSANGG